MSVTTKSKAVTTLTPIRVRVRKGVLQFDCTKGAKHTLVRIDLKAPKWWLAHLADKLNEVRR